MGKAFKLGNDVNTDEIIPGRYNVTLDIKQLARHCFYEAKPDFVKKVKKGDYLVGGENFGCGSSREHAPLAILGTGIKAVIAKSFARIFFRNAINIGLPILISKKAAQEIKEGNEIGVDLKKGLIFNLTTKKEYQAEKLTGFVLEIIKKGGLVNYAKK